ncbi:hypothetical protein SUGI_0192200 [Cryptomeria japonica]|nr:hypothetical protein SUGI_0192200 [Cryptomeria japonica]
MNEVSEFIEAKSSQKRPNTWTAEEKKVTKFGMGPSAQTVEGYSSAILSPPRAAEVMRSKHISATIGEISVLAEPISTSHPLRLSSFRENVKSEAGLSRHLSIDEEGVHAQTQPLINNQRRRRCASESNICEMGGLRRRQQSFRDGVGHAAAETYLLTRLSFKLLRYLGVGYRWITKFLALGFYAMCLLPGFLQIGYYYYFSKCVHRSIVYGEEPRNRLDLYIPENNHEPKPVVAFVTGGAWIIGYKAWGSLLGQELVERDVIVACIDYRNFPQGTISDMVKDASQGISFVCQNIAEYGGDPSRIYVVGQSAGAHISSCVLVHQAIEEAKIGRENLSWSTSQIKAYFGISGGYNLLHLVDHFHKRGLYRSIFLSVMEGEDSLAHFSPEILVQNPSYRDAVSLLPPFYLLHGTGDYSIPSEASTKFSDVLQSVGAQAEVKLYKDKTHTDLFLQDPMRGGKDELLEDILSVIHAGDPVALANDAIAPPRRRLVPEILLKLAHKVSPF